MQFSSLASFRNRLENGRGWSDFFTTSAQLKAGGSLCLVKHPGDLCFLHYRNSYATCKTTKYFMLDLSVGGFRSYSQVGRSWFKLAVTWAGFPPFSCGWQWVFQVHSEDSPGLSPSAAWVLLNRGRWPFRCLLSPMVVRFVSSSPSYCQHSVINFGAAIHWLESGTKLPVFNSTTDRK